MSYDVMAKLKNRAGDIRHLGPCIGHHGRRIAWQLLVIGSLICIGMGVSGIKAQPAGSLEAVASKLSGELVRYFPSVTGEVIKVDGNHLYVDLGAKDEVWRGLRLLVYRQGEQLKRPTTGEVLGHDEMPLGYLTLVQVSENHAVGGFVPADERVSVQPGDKVRLTAARIDMSLLPPTGQLPADWSQTAIGGHLKDALEATGRFRVQGVDRVNAWLLERNVAADAAVESPYLQMLTKSLQTPYLIQPVFKAVQGQSILALRLIASTQTEPVAEASSVVSETGAGVTSASPPPLVVPVPQGQDPSTAQGNYGGLFQQPLMMQPGGFPWNLAEGMTELHHFEDELIGLDAGDPDGDGQVDVVITTENQVSLYHLSDQKLQLVDMVKTDVWGHFISAQLVQIDAGSTLGIVVNHQVGNEGIESFVLALQGQKLVYWQKQIYEILLAVDSNGDGANDQIWAQPFDQKHFFKRDAVRVYLPSNGNLEHQNNLKMPYLFRVTGAVLAMMKAPTGTNRQLVFIDERHRLQVYHEGEQLWQSSDAVGGSYAQAQLSQNSDMDIRISDYVTSTFSFEPIPEPIDVDGDGVDEILVIRNDSSLGGVVPYRTRYTTGDVALLRAGPYGFNLSPVSPKFDGMVSGVSVTPEPVPGVLIAISKREGILGKKQRTIVFLSRLPLS
jgi:hypothetical protein